MLCHLFYGTFMNSGDDRLSVLSLYIENIVYILLLTMVNKDVY